VQQQEKVLSDAARERHQFRDARLEREKREKQERHKKKRAALEAKKEDTGNSSVDAAADAKKAAIQAAMNRAKAKREVASISPKNTDNLTADQQQKIDDANARRAKIRAAEAQNNAQNNAQDTKQDPQQDPQQDNKP